MLDLHEHILRQFFMVLLVLFVNYILLIGLRDILYFILRIGARTGGAKPRHQHAKGLLPRLLFWIIFFSIAFFLPSIVILFVLFILFAYILFRAGERMRIGPGLITIISAAFLTTIASVFLYTQQILVKTENQFLAAMWVYNTSNTTIDILMTTAMKFNLDTRGIENLASIVPFVQRNLFGVLFLSIYIMSQLFLKQLVKIILPFSNYNIPEYYRIPPTRLFAAVAALCIITDSRHAFPQFFFVVCGIYYLWGINLLIFILRWGHWLLYLLILAAGAFHPVSVCIFIAMGVTDNLLDVRRLSAFMGLDPATGKIRAPT